jgi:hypothetical protein
VTQPNPFRPVADLYQADIDFLIDDLDGRLGRLEVPSDWASSLTLTCHSCIACTSTCNGCTNGCTNRCLDDFGGRLGQW